MPTNNFYGQDAYTRMCKILIGAETVGDDGEDAVIDMFYIKDGIPMIRFTQEDGCKYDFELEGYLDSINLDDEDYDEVREYLDAFYDEDITESISYQRKKENQGHKRKLILDEEEAPTKFNTHKDWRHKR